MWFSVVCTLIDNDTRHHSGQNVVSPQHILITVVTRIVVDKNADHAKPHSICLFTTISTAKVVFFQSVTKIVRDTKKEQALSITFSQSDWFISQNERF